MADPTCRVGRYSRSSEQLPEHPRMQGHRAVLALSLRIQRVPSNAQALDAHVLRKLLSLR
jgi:hypothetical protein